MRWDMYYSSAKEMKSRIILLKQRRIEKSKFFCCVLAQYKVLHQSFRLFLCVPINHVYTRLLYECVRVCMNVQVCMCHYRTCTLPVRASLALMRKNSSQFLATGAQSISERVSLWESACASIFECCAVQMCNLLVTYWRETRQRCQTTYRHFPFMFYGVISPK